MKQQSIFTRLQTQYHKLTQLLLSKGNQFSQFKHQQILNRISRCSLQLKRLGLGMGVCLALGGTPVVGQVSLSFIKHDGTENPIEGLASVVYDGQSRPTFVDIDGDGDYDFFLNQYISDAYSNKYNKYYENVGTSTNASFVLRTGIQNPLDTILGFENFEALEFVDIDNDGDFDFFASGRYNTSSDISLYFENTGTPQNPTFTQRTGALNPLDSINYHLITTNKLIISSFVDIDNDGDFDCFAMKMDFSSPQQFWYYENQGTNSAPNFLKKSGTNNPLNAPNSFSLFQTPVSASRYKAEFYDFDGDSDKDLFVLGIGFLYQYFENTGNITSPIFISTTGQSTGTALDSLVILDNGVNEYTLVDIDGDSDLDVFSTAVNDLFFENTTITTNIEEIQDKSLFIIYPNPTTGILNFESPITGTVSLYNIAGQQIWGKELYEEQKIELSELDNGIYFLHIETTKERFRKKLLIQK